MSDSWLITGASGRLGHQLCSYLRNRGARVVGLRHHQPVDIDGVEEHAVDFAEPAQLEAALREADCRHIVHTAGLTDVDGCESRPDDARMLHVEATRQIAALARETGAHLTCISTDHLWDGQTPFVAEDTPPDPMNEYARTKLAGEAAALSEMPDALVLRTNFFGAGRPWRPSFSDWIDKTLRGDQPATLFDDVFFSPIAIELFCPIIEEMAVRNAGGIYHACGRERLSKYEFGLRYADIFGIPTDRIRPISVTDTALKAPRPRDMSLSTHKIEVFLGRSLPDCTQSLLALKNAAEDAAHPTDGPGETAPRDLFYGRQHVEQDDIDAVTGVLRSDYLTQGPVSERFETEFARKVEAKYAVAVSSGTAALHIACQAAGAEPGILGVAPTMTFMATANALLYCGADVALCDCDPDHLGLSGEALSATLAQRPEAAIVLTVAFGGLAANAAETRSIAGDRIVIEDTAHALGGTYDNGRPVGCCCYSDMSVFSFHPVKSITSGEGGIVTTNDDELARRLRLYRNHGIERDPARFESAGSDAIGPWYYEQQVLGYNYRMSDIHAALGLSQLGKLDRFIARRREVARKLDDAFASLPATNLYHSDAEDRSRSALHLYIAGLDFQALGTDRTTFIGSLRNRGVAPQVHYIPIHRQPVYRRRLNQTPADYPNAETYYNGCLSLPVHADLTDGEVDRVIDAFRDSLAEYGAGR